MKSYSISFFFPSQPGSRQEKFCRVEASNVGTALARAWWEVRRDPKYKGRRGLDQCRIGVTQIGEVPRVQSSEGEEGTEA